MAQADNPSLGLEKHSEDVRQAYYECEHLFSTGRLNMWLGAFQSFSKWAAELTEDKIDAVGKLYGRRFGAKAFRRLKSVIDAVRAARSHGDGATPFIRSLDETSFWLARLKPSDLAALLRAHSVGTDPPATERLLTLRDAKALGAVQTGDIVFLWGAAAESGALAKSGVLTKGCLCGDGVLAVCDRLAATPGEGEGLVRLPTLFVADLYERPLTVDHWKRSPVLRAHVNQGWWLKQLIRIEREQAVEMQRILDRLNHPEATEEWQALEVEVASFRPKSAEQFCFGIQRTIVQRHGSQLFRTRLLRAYDGRCAVTGCDVEEVLDAALLRPHMGSGAPPVSLGILLRVDVHTLFDLGQLRIEYTDGTYTLHVSRGLKHSSYMSLHGKQLRLPAERSEWPSVEALRAHGLGLHWV
ncbi:MAG: hypothetical protein HZB13_01775 [Acidobacteria bacterium]|nr:hypothetical protein [Acidobacteriota bacterium]